MSLHPTSLAMEAMDSELKPHFILVPLMAQGHMIPMVDMARLLAEHDATVTFVTTPVNASRIKTIIERIEASKLPIKFLKLQFPCEKVGLPEGYESADLLSGLDQIMKFVDASAMLKESLITCLKGQYHSPTCIIADTNQPWVGDVARELGIPRLAFNGSGAFPNLAMYIIRHQKIFDDVKDDKEIISIPGFPHRLEMTKAKAPLSVYRPGMEQFMEKRLKEERIADGMVVNTFHELESLYVESYAKTAGKKIWTIGPMLLCNKNIHEFSSRGNKASINEEDCSCWLDSMKPGSVVYVSFGSLAQTTVAQLAEIGLGLEASNKPFVWVIKSGDKPDVEEWLCNDFEERVKDRGLIIKGWAPQMMILSHPAIGGFLTHCGWNSTLESICTGVPMITWPHFADQFLNEMLIVEILKIGMKIGVEEPNQWVTDKESKNDNDVMVKRDDVAKAVLELMDEGEEMRERARELARKAREAMNEGGSSFNNIIELIKQFGDASKIFSSS
ncbi:Glycosyltransferase [Rhynchospora pubera]|uniref:Glycosyltransferase n=1 Tax=Rhynchospora pubera TaxID=906938 RepID=A0AAV8CCS8_9POAL|nr:Glycosyltransferase [Rhynchospora pubera]KAJ4752291.1 Glycosyltransferase [Rhynchospora pubera]